MNHLQKICREATIPSKRDLETRVCPLLLFLVIFQPSFCNYIWGFLSAYYFQIINILRYNSRVVLCVTILTMLTYIIHSYYFYFKGILCSSLVFYLSAFVFMSCVFMYIFWNMLIHSNPQLPPASSCLHRWLMGWVCVLEWGACMHMVYINSYNQKDSLTRNETLPLMTWLVWHGSSCLTYLSFSFFVFKQEILYSFIVWILSELSLCQVLW